MREIIARIVCATTVFVVLALSWLFAARHNPAPGRLVAADSTRPAPRAELDPRVERGRIVYAAQGCASCHSIRGLGNPRHPLDEVGARLGAAELRDFVTGSGRAAEKLPSTVVRRKAKYRELPEDDLAALTAYLSSLRAALPP